MKVNRMNELQNLGQVQVADIYKGEHLAGYLTRTSDGVSFAYTSDYISSTLPPIATSLPKVNVPRLTPAGGIPPFFAGLLPEGRRLTHLRRMVKTSSDDELSLLLAIGGDTVGDVQIIPSGNQPVKVNPLAEVTSSFGEIKFSDLLNDPGRIDPVGIPGVQEKVSAGRITLPTSRAGHQYILKFESQDYPNIIENENYFLSVARETPLKVVSSELVHDADGRSGLLVTRFDREIDSKGKITPRAVEDGCQVLDRWPADKYNFSAEELIQAVSAVCASKRLAIRELFTQFCLAWITGNGDLHAKNVSILKTPDGEWRVSPAYDLPSTVPYADLPMALTINGRKIGHSRKSLVEFGVSVGLSQKLATKVLDVVLEATSKMLDELRNGAIPFNQQINSDLISELRHRRSTLLS
jgi:serine/threonine-protein kinase HipA